MNTDKKNKVRVGSKKRKTVWNFYVCQYPHSPKMGDFFTQPWPPRYATNPRMLRADKSVRYEEAVE